MKSLLLTAVMFTCTTSIAAQELHVQIHGLSYHSVRTQANGDKWNERNDGIGLRYQINETLDAQIGVYNNSQFRTSKYAVATWLPVEVGVVRVGVFGGVVTGYSYRNGGAIPAGGLAARWQGERLSVTSRFVPKVPQNASSVFSVELGVKF